MRSLLSVETAAYLQKKFEDHRVYSVFAFALATVLGPSLWIWDYVTDPVGAQNTIALRLLFLNTIVFVWAFQRSDNRRLLAITSMGAMLMGEVIFVVILGRLHDGMVYGSGGFLIFMYAPLMLFTGFSLRLNLCYLLAAGGLPQLLAIAGMEKDFQHAQYAVLIWPTVVAMVAIQFASANNYYRRSVLEEALALASNTDALTGARNRRYFLPRLRQEIARSHRGGSKLSLLMLDIDNFKLINDTYGHPTGDVVICKLVDICHQESREIDVVARLGGEEFGILLPDADRDAAYVLAERIRSAVERTRVNSLSDGIEFGFTVSIGVAERPAEDYSEERLFGLADAALYRAKSSGRNRVTSTAT
jgi:diguanylate cyclase (GGDEF)-like protein